MLRVRRAYQSWVANESLEDYALRYASSTYRRWSPAVVATTALGGISFLALEAIGASITLNYGFVNALAAVLAVSLVIFLTSIPIAYWSAVANVDIDLLTRGAGFGFIGSTVTSLIYASFTFIFFAIETAIWAQALELALGLNLVVGYLLCSLVIIPVVFFGVTAINRLQAWTQPLWLLMLLAPPGFILWRDPSLLQAWVSFPGQGGGFTLLGFGAATGVLFSLAGQIGEQADYLRFLPDRTARNRRAWWAALLGAGPGWIGIGAFKICVGSLLAVLVLRTGGSAAQAVEPIQMFNRAYSLLIDDATLVIVLATLYVTLSQVKINVTNAYSGSLAWSNCFARLAHYHPGRVVWLVFNVVIALMLSLMGIFTTLEAVLSVYSTVAIAWIGALVADLVVLKRTGISPPYIEFKRAHLYDINPVGCGATVIASVAAVAAYAGVFGIYAQAFFGFIALVVSFVSAIAIAYLTRGRFYIARADRHFREAPRDRLETCCICERQYEAPDMAHCPFYRSPICSLCCGLELHCHDFCKKPADVQKAGEAESLAARFQPHVLRRVGRFCGLLGVVATLLGMVFVLTYRFMDLHSTAADPSLINVMIRLYLGTLVVSSLGVWWIVLSQEAREQSEREVLESMDHLERTRRELLESEKLAALGGLVARVAHEINTPVGIVVSTASFLDDRTQATRNALNADRLDPPALQKYLRDAGEAANLLLHNARRAAQLVHGFKQLAIDRISEERRNFDLSAHLAETLSALRSRFDDARVELIVTVPGELPMHSFPVALAQVVTNIAVNALQHAFEGRNGGRFVVEAVPVAGDLVRLSFSDDGCGIPEALRTRVFEPFFTTRRMLGGSGLGLYIVHQLVTRQLGGTITLQTPAGGGSRFVLELQRSIRHGPEIDRLIAAPAARNRNGSL